MSESAQIAITTVQTLLVILNIVGNSLVCVIIVKNQEMRTSVNYLLLNLAVADMIAGIFLAPGYIFIHTFTHPDGVTGNVLFKLLTGPTWGWVGACASVFTLVAIAIERYYTVVHPLGNKERLTKRKIKVIVPFSWIFGQIVNIPWVLVMTYSKEAGAFIEMWPENWMGKAYGMTWFLLIALFPVSLMAALYIRVVYTLWFRRTEHSQQQERLGAKEPLALDEAFCQRWRTEHSQQQGVMKVRKRVTLTVIAVSVLFGVCYLTNSANYLMSFYFPSRVFLSLYASIIPIFFNSAINSIVYALVNHRFREKFKKIMSFTFHPAANVVHPTREPHDDYQMMELAIGPQPPDPGHR